MTLQAVPPLEPEAAEVRPHPVGRDPARPHRPARRRGAGDPGAGRRPDLDPDPRHQEPRAGDRDPRPDGAARALRPRGEPRAAFDRRPETSRSRRSRSTRCSPASRPWSRRRRPSPGTSSTPEEEASPARWPRRTSCSRARSSRRPARRASCRRAGRSSACRRRPSCSRAASARSSARASTSRTRPELLLPVRNGEFKNSDGSVKTVPEMRGDDLKLSGTRQDFDTTTGEPIVTMQFTDKGADKFAEITNNIADRGKALFNLSGGGGDPQNTFQHFAIVLDRQIKSCAVDRLGAVPERDQRHERRPDHRDRRHQRGEEPRARAADRRPARHVHRRSSRPRSRPRSAPTRSRRPGRPRSPASSPSRSSCSSSTACSASSP